MNKIKHLLKLPSYLYDGFKNALLEWSMSKFTDDDGEFLEDYPWNNVYVSPSGSGDMSGSDLANTKPLSDATNNARVGDNIIGFGACVGKEADAVNIFHRQ